MDGGAGKESRVLCKSRGCIWEIWAKTEIRKYDQPSPLSSQVTRLLSSIQPCSSP